MNDFDKLKNDIDNCLDDDTKRMTNDDLFKIYAKDKTNIELRNQIALKNMLLIPYIIKRNKLFVDKTHNYDEMVSEGFIYLLKAVETFDIELGYQFSSYASKVILGCTRGRYDYNEHTSLETPISSEDETMTLEDVIEDDSSLFEDEVINNEFYLQVRAALEYNLDDLEYQVIKYIFGFGEDKKTYKEICQALDITDNTLRTTKAEALRKLRKSTFFKNFDREFNHNYSYIRSSSLYGNDRVTSSYDYTSMVERYLLSKEEKERDYIKELLSRNVNNYQALRG